MFEPKYIKTEDDKIIIFPAYLQHSKFKHFNPISAGFISIRTNEKHEPDIYCYGESVSLNLKSDIEDTKLAIKQFINYYY